MRAGRRTLSTMFAAGVPLVEALDSVAGAAGNTVYYKATKKIQQEVTTGTSLTVVDAEQRRVPEHGAADVRDRRGVGRARRDALARWPTSSSRKSTTRSMRCRA